MTAAGVFVTFELPATRWRRWLGPSCRARLMKLAPVAFPEDGALAVVVLGPVERDSITADAIRYVTGRVGVYPREAFADAPAVTPAAAPAATRRASASARRAARPA